LSLNRPNTTKAPLNQVLCLEIKKVKFIAQKIFLVEVINLFSINKIIWQYYITYFNKINCFI